MLRSTCFITLITILTIAMYLSEVQAGSKTKVKISNSKYGSKTKIKIKNYKSPGLKSKYFLAGGALATGLYIGSNMRHSNYYGRIHSDSRFNVCEGRYMNVEAGFTEPVNAFICPDDPTDLSERYCCYNDLGYGMCCDYQDYTGSSVGGSIGGIMGLFLVGVAAYCCCCRKKKTEETTTVIVQEGTAVPMQQHPFIGKPGEPQVPPYPGSPQNPGDIGFNTGGIYPPAQYPVQTVNPNAPPAGVPYPSAVPGYPSQPGSNPMPGSGWNAPPQPPPYSSLSQEKA